MKKETTQEFLQKAAERYHKDILPQLIENIKQKDDNDAIEFALGYCLGMFITRVNQGFIMSAESLKDMFDKSYNYAIECIISAESLKDMCDKSYNYTIKCIKGVK